MGGDPVWHLGPPDDVTMRVPDTIKECVVFLGSYTSVGTRLVPVPEGTAFWVSIRNLEERAGAGTSTYLVTARHVVEGLSRKNGWFIRVNGSDGQAKIARPPRSARWHFHQDPGVDVAVLPMVPDPFRPEGIISHFSFVGDIESSRRAGIGVGDEVFITGLFAFVAGNKRNIPIVRMGNIAMVPGEPVPTKRGEMDAYLIEARSIGGISGSPCFVRGTIRGKDLARRRFARPSLGRRGGMKTEDGLRIMEDLHHVERAIRELQEATEEQPLGVSEEYRLLGLMHGHWDIPAEAKNDSARDVTGKVNVGIAIVVPAVKILEVLMRPELVAQRRRSGEVVIRRFLPTMDAKERERLTGLGFDLDRIAREPDPDAE